MTPRISRRSFLGQGTAIALGSLAAGAFGLGAGGVRAAPSALRALPGRYAFAVWLGRSSIGSQSLQVRHRGGELVLEHRRRLQVKLLFITAYDLDHHSVETWRDGHLLHLRSDTVESGRRERLVGERVAGGFRVELGDGADVVHTAVLPAQVSTSNSFWLTPDLQRPHLVGSTDGDQMLPRIERLPEAVIDGVVTERYRLGAGDTDAQAWFVGGLLQRALFQHDGHEVEYRRS